MRYKNSPMAVLSILMITSIYAQEPVDINRYKNVFKYNESEAIVVTNRPKIGVGVLIIKGTSLLLGKRKNAHGHDSWAPPGGHLEHGESWDACARREVLEETGLQLSAYRFLGITNDIFDEQRHYVTIFMRADYTGGQVQNLEPDKCYEWQWFDIGQLPDNLFLSLRNLLREHPMFVQQVVNVERIDACHLSVVGDRSLC